MTQAPDITISIDGRTLTVPAGTTVLQAAERLGIRIPTLCYHPRLSIPGACRVCIVQVEGMDAYVTACNHPVWEAMAIQTLTPEIRQARRDIVELLLDNHPMDCQTCERDGRCELQNLAYTLGVRERLFAGERKSFAKDDHNRAVQREPDKCILCGRCVRVCAEVQGVHNLSQQGRGFRTLVSPAHGANMDDSVCVHCGQCVSVCPTAAFLEQSSTERVWAALADPNITVIAQTAPAVRVAVGEGFGLPPGTVHTGRMVAALRALGFDAVFDTNFGADLTIVEESHELIQRLASGQHLPMLTSCSPAWINYMERFFPELIHLASTCRSPMSMTSSLIKTYYAEKRGLNPDQIFVVGIMPCVAKKYEASRPELTTTTGRPLTDAVLTTREFVWMVKACGIDYWTLQHIDLGTFPEETFDAPLGLSSGAGDIFGTTGGVMEATLRTAAAQLAGDDAPQLEFTAVRHATGVRRWEVTLDQRRVQVAVVDGLAQAHQLLRAVHAGQEHLDVIEVMACPSGCVGGGGQPYPPAGVKALDPEMLRQRAQALYSIDAGKTLRRSHENPAIKALYRDFLGQPGSDKAHQLLHTSYGEKSPRGIAK